MIIDAKGCWDASQAQHKAYFDLTVNAKLASSGRSLRIIVRRFLIDNHDQIRDGDEHTFRIVQGKFEKILAGLSEKSRAATLRAVKNIYNYDAFSKKHPVNWCAYSLCAQLSVLTCPYCNLSYGHTLRIGSDGIVRPTLDHYFDKASYPLFAISLGNLVASCYQCNSSLKGKKNFFNKRHLNPLKSDEKIKLALDIDPLKAKYDLRVFDTANIKLKFDLSDAESRNSVATFRLQERYQLLVDEARFIARSMQLYSNQAMPDLVRLEWLRRGVSDRNYKNRVLGKLIKDFSETFLPKGT